ncbi:hypothetical protein L6472_02410 [Prevotella sp. E13-17]|uniref:hypothetical protein n=1 Tax=Prevotella sp. E13-17 TaxID=2913616 RepID=UPI001EDA9FFE|nr:hypothetical protein [Prevotella sp. E13-17]UKK51464.1 hypothetical protein L6472_02410 [Prevotella sp. E13-17]
MKKLLSIFTLMLLMSASGAWAQDAKHLITATYREQTRSLEQPLPYATTIGALYEAVTGEPFSDLISSMSSVGMPLTGITSRNTSVVSIGELNGASTPVTVNADGETIINLIFGNYAQGILVSAISPLYAYVKDGVKDAGKWTVKVGEGEAQWLPIGGLKGDGSETVTLQYNGRMKVKGVKATSDAAPAEPSVPDGAINGKFSVSDGKQVYFSKGNLRYASGAWSFFDNQYDYYATYSADAWDKFGWSNSTNNFGMSTSTENAVYQGDLVDWGTVPGIGTGWRTLTKDEWNYLFMTRESGSKVNGMSPSPDNARYTHATINTDNGTGGIRGMILFPDGVTVNYSDATSWGGINQYSNWNGSTKCTTSQWNALAAKGFVFLPTGGVRNGTTISNSNNNGYYWSSYTASPTSGYAYYTRVVASTEPTTAYDSRKIGISVRLVREVATSDAPAKEPATVTTAPTGAAGLTTASAVTEKLATGGVADGGTLKYAITSTTTQPDDAAFTLTISPTVSDLKTALSMSTLAAGTYYVWYKVFADADHADSEAAYVSVAVAPAETTVTWNSSNIGGSYPNGLYVSGTDMPYEKEGITLSGNADMIHAEWYDYGDPTEAGISFKVYGSGGFTFTAPTGKKFTKIEMTLTNAAGWDIAYEEEKLGTGWAFNIDWETRILTVTWKGSAAVSTVGLLTGANDFSGGLVNSIVFTLVDAE